MYILYKNGKNCYNKFFKFLVALTITLIQSNLALASSLQKKITLYMNNFYSFYFFLSAE